MRQKAVAEQSGDEQPQAPATSYALAVEPDASQAAVLERILGARIGGTLKVVGSTEEAFAALERRLPDLILVSPLLAPPDEEQIVARLAARGGDASHVQLLSDSADSRRRAAERKETPVRLAVAERCLERQRGLRSGGVRQRSCRISGAGVDAAAGESSRRP